MTQIHVVVRRVNPAIKIDLVQVGRLEGDQFVSLPFSAVADSPIACFLKSSHISDSLYIDHSEIAAFVTTCEKLPGFCVEFFDNTLIVMFNLDLDCNEGAKEEEGKGN